MYFQFSQRSITAKEPSGRCGTLVNTGSQRVFSVSHPRRGRDIRTPHSRKDGNPGNKERLEKVMEYSYNGETSDILARMRTDRARRRIERRKAARARMWRVVSVGSVVLILAAAVFWGVAAWPRLVTELTVEAGSPLPTAEDFVQSGFFRAEITGGLSPELDSRVLGDRVVSLRVLGMDRTAVVHVVDTVPPEAEVQDLRRYDFQGAAPEDFLLSLRDETETRVAFLTEPDWTVPGVQEVAIEVTDQGGNRTVVQANLDVVIDTTPPVISGVEELTIPLGGTVSYKKGVTVTDDCDENVSLEVDNHAVDLDKPGTYSVIYTATDFAGNRAEVKTRLYVLSPMPENITEEQVYAAADRLLAEILTPEMDQYQQAKAIYNWCHNRINYVSTSDKDNWLWAAYQGIEKRSGDCYVYCMSAKVLLTRAGIPNRLIEKIPTNTLHYWNLIDIGEGWHHFDTTRRVGNPNFFYLTDSELMAYSNAHRGTHNYDHSVYTDIVP